MSEYEKALSKIKKCLALSKSSNPNEAATALRQAQALMNKYAIDMSTVELSSVKESIVLGANAKKPPVWYWRLCQAIEIAFGVDSYHSYKGRRDNTVFIGIAPKQEIAAYVFEIIYRKIKKERKNHQLSLSLHLDKYSKIRKADKFAEAFVQAIAQTINEFAIPQRDQELINQYKANIGLKEVKARRHPFYRTDIESIIAGEEAAKDVHLYHAVRESDQRRLA